MEARSHLLKGGRTLLIREAAPEDARALLAYVESISTESDFLSFGAGEFGYTEAQEADLLRKYREADSHVYLIGLLDRAIVATTAFSAGGRPRVRHTGELGMSVQRQHWGQGIGALMLDTLVQWARATGTVTKLNLRVRTDNARAIRLYERCGFVREGTMRRELFVGGRYFDVHWMGLTL